MTPTEQEMLTRYDIDRLFNPQPLTKLRQRWAARCRIMAQQMRSEAGDLKDQQRSELLELADLADTIAAKVSLMSKKRAPNKTELRK